MLNDQQKERTEIVAVSVDPPEQIQMMKDRVMRDYQVMLNFTILTDENHLVIDRYGLFNPNESKRRPVPHPTAMVVDRDGIVRWKFTEVNYRIRPENEDILEALAEVQGKGS